VVLNLVTAIGAVGGGVASGDTSGMVSAGKAAKVEVENNSLSDIAQAQSEGKRWSRRPVSTSRRKTNATRRKTVPD